jgi:hypothetical protein
MKLSKKILLLGFFIFAVLTGIGLFLMSTIAVGNPEAAKRIVESWGIAMGVLIGFIGVWWWAERRKNG